MPDGMQSVATTSLSSPNTVKTRTGDMQEPNPRPFVAPPTWTPPSQTASAVTVVVVVAVDERPRGTALTPLALVAPAKGWVRGGTHRCARVEDGGDASLKEGTRGVIPGQMGG